MNTEKRVNLIGVLDHTASSAQIKSDGSLVIELYDFSSGAESWFGNDVAFLLKVSPWYKGIMLSRLLEDEICFLVQSREDELLLGLIEERFKDYYDVKQWMDEKKILYETEFDSWA